VVASKGTPWSGLERYGCGCWVENDPQSLADGLRRVWAMSREVVSSKAITWMKTEFSWERQARLMLTAYESMLARA
jgi:hypothetical protein